MKRFLPVATILLGVACTIAMVSCYFWSPAFSRRAFWLGASAVLCSTASVFLCSAELANNPWKKVGYTLFLSVATLVFLFVPGQTFHYVITPLVKKSGMIRPYFDYFLMGLMMFACLFTIVLDIIITHNEVWLQKRQRITLYALFIAGFSFWTVTYINDATSPFLIAGAFLAYVFFTLAVTLRKLTRR